MKKIGVFSGTFDPFHIAHLKICLASKAALKLDLVDILVESSPVRKQNVSSLADRLQMIKLATAEYKNINVLDFDEDNVTVNTALDVLDRHYSNAEYWYILGSDLLDYIDSWQDFKKLTENFNLCVVLRSNKDKSKTNKKLQKIAEQYRALNYKILPEVGEDISSAKIKQQITASGFSDQLDKNVMKYIQDNNIY